MQTADPTQDPNWTPIPYDPEFEVIEADEAKTVEGLVESLANIAKTTFEHSGHAIRGVHVKSHGLLRGELRCSTTGPTSWRRASSLHLRAGPW